MAEITPQQARRELERRRSVGTFAEFVREYNTGHAHTIADYRHGKTLVKVAEDVCRGYIDRLLVLMPPGYLKSTTFSQLLPAYYLHRYPRRNVGLASHTASLAWEHSDSARENYKQAGGETLTSKDAKRMWGNSHGGKMWAEGMGATITGKRYDIGVVDDPLAQQDARSKAAKKEFRQWWPGTWHNRAEPGGQMIVVMQRLAEDDPINFLFRREVGDDTEKAPEHWTVLCLDEIKSDEPLASYDGPMGLPTTCTLIEDDRELGEILAPKRYDEDEVGKHQRGSGEQSDAQRQQRPSAPSGDFWKESWFEIFGDPSNAPRDDVPEGAQAHGKDWDTAYTDKERNSATAYVESAETTQDGETIIWVYGCDWRWKEFPDLIPWMQRLDAPHYVEGKASGKSVVQTLERQNVKAQEVEVEGGDKYARANSVRGIVGSEEEGGTGRVRVHASIADKLLLGEDQGLLRVRSEQLAEGEGDLDLNDAFVQALNRHVNQEKASIF